MVIIKLYRAGYDNKMIDSQMEKQSVVGVVEKNLSFYRMLSDSENSFENYHSSNPSIQNTIRRIGRPPSQHPTHPLHKFTVLTENERQKKKTIFDNNNNYTVNINTKSDLICEDLIQSNLKLIHSHIVSNHLSQRPPNKVLQDQTPSVSPAELLLSRETRRTLAQLRTNKSPLLVSYLFSIGDPRHPSPLCPLCLMHDHTSSHLFECKSLPTSLSSLDLWTNPDKVEPFLATWGERLLAAT